MTDPPAMDKPMPDCFYGNLMKSLKYGKKD
jgi:hypothetical protein